MENAPHLYDTLVHVLSQYAEWSDQRHVRDHRVSTGNLR